MSSGGVEPPSPPPAPSPARRWAIGCGTTLVALVVVALFALRLGQGVYARLVPLEEVQAPPIALEVVALTPQPFTFTVPISGTLAPVHSVDVFPKVGGRVVEVYVGLGDEVAAGDPLARVETVEYGLMAEQARVGFEMADEAAGMAERSLERLDAVHERLGEGALSEQDYDSARVEVEGAQTQRELARIQRELAVQQVRNATLRAPVDGAVARINARLGGMIGQEYPAFHIADTSSLIVRCEVGDLDLPRVAVGQRVLLSTDSMPDTRLVGEVIAVSPSLDAWTRRAPVEIAVPNPDGVIVGNVFSRGEIIVGEEAAALVVPMVSVRRGAEGAAVQLVRDSRITEVEVTVLGESEDRIAVSGLAVGDLVVIPGPMHLAEGEIINAVLRDPVTDHVAQ